MLFAAVAVAYFSPTLVAVARRSRWLSSIGVINASIGWTGYGWWWAMSMAVDSTPQRRFSAIDGLRDDSGRTWQRSAEDDTSFDSAAANAS